MHERVEGDIGRRDEERYEQQVDLKAAQLFGFGWGGNPVAWPKVMDPVNRLVERAGLSPDDEANPNLSDPLWRPAAVRDTVIVAKASLSIDPTGVVRAKPRAETLKAAGLKAVPVIVDRNLPARAWELAA